MKLKNITKSDIVAGGITFKAGENSENIDDALARKIVAQSPGVLAVAPEREHEPEELAHADNKEQDHPIEWAVDPVQFVKEGGILHKSRL